MKAICSIICLIAFTCSAARGDALSAQQSFSQTLTAMRSVRLNSKKVEQLTLQLFSEQTAQLLIPLIAKEIETTMDARIRGCLGSMLHDVHPFPRQEIVSYLKNNPEPHARLAFLIALDQRQPKDDPEIKQLTHEALFDEREGTRDYFGGWRGSARVCDEIYNIIMHNLGEAYSPTYPISCTNHSPEQRNELIASLCERLGIVRSVVDPPKSSHISSPAALNSPNPQISPETMPSTLTEEPASSTPWSIMVMILILAACALLWLLLQRRK